jgi:hypothetical protein
MRLDDEAFALSHEGVHSIPASGNVMQHFGAFGFVVERPFDGLDLASDSSYAIEQLLFLFCCAGDA